LKPFSSTGLWVILVASAMQAGAGTVPRDKYAWLEGQHDPTAVAWAAERTLESIRELRAKPIAAQVEAELRDALKTDAPVPHYELLGTRIGRFVRDVTHPLGAIEIARRGADGRPEGAWQTVLDAGTLDQREHANYELMEIDLRSLCQAPAFERCLIPLSPGASEIKEWRELDLARGGFVEHGFRLSHQRASLAWLNADTLLISTSHGEDGKPFLKNTLPAVVRLWKRNTRFASAKVILRSAPTDSGIFIEGALGAGAARRGILVLMKDYLTFETYLVDARGVLIPTHLPTRIKGFGSIPPTEHDIVVQLAEGATIGRTSYPPEAVLAYDAREGIPEDRRISLVLVPEPGTYINDPIDGLTCARTTISMVTDRNLTKSLISAERGPNGWTIRKVMSGPPGTRMLLSADPDSDDVLVRTEGFLQPETITLIRPGSPPAPIDADKPLIDASRFVTEIRSARSKDGTGVDYYLVRARSPAPGPVPTIIYGYGGFGVNADPNYFGTGLGRTRRSWMIRGGAFVVAAIRGGGERGSAWYEGGRGHNKQNSFDDFAAVAEDLVQTGFSVPSKIGIHGRSNGGMLVAVEVTEHPELYGAALIGAPVTDVPGFLKGSWGIGPGMLKELGDPNDPSDLAYMLTWSPYQNVRAGVKYPKILITTSTEDNQVGAGQARRFAAKLAEVGAHPLLIEWPTGGHPFPNEVAHTQEAALQMTFLIDALMQ
jgi:prolyl oligopeptidase